ncbi:MAG: hypothetical protein H7329_08425 [Opitutaceae bacterium]|nr:hypothetical protein [Cytophagales bacterium]
MKKRVNYSEAEKDKILKDAMFHKLKEMKIDKASTHTQLEFQLQFDDDYSQKTRTVTLCESCFVHFNEHKSKFK